MLSGGPGVAASAGLGALWVAFVAPWVPWEGARGLPGFFLALCGLFWWPSGAVGGPSWGLVLVTSLIRFGNLLENYSIATTAT